MKRKGPIAMQMVRLNLLDAESLDDLREAGGLMEQAGEVTAYHKLTWMKSIFSVGNAVGRRETLPLARIPAVGEYLCLPMEEDVWYRVQIVLHTPGQASYLAEIWAWEEIEENESAHSDAQTPERRLL